LPLRRRSGDCRGRARDFLSLFLRDDRLDLPRQPVDVADQAVPVEHKDLALGHLGHEAKELEVVAMKAIGVIEATAPTWAAGAVERSVVRGSRAA
jgi:hypothetical protein